MKAIETSYAGCRFRSRLEARWAVFFDTLGVPWEYEPQGYEVAGRAYLPDFLLTDCSTWVEVKGHEAALDREFLCKAAAELPRLPGPGENGPALLVLGPIPPPRPGAADFGWVGIERAHYEDWPGLGRWGFGTYHKNRRPWWLDGAEPNEPWLTPTADTFEWDEALSAYNAARSARFEYGQSGAA